MDIGLRNTNHMMLYLSILLITFLFYGCSSIKPPAELSYNANLYISSVSSNASLAYKSPLKTISGSGILMYKKPDQVRMVVLSPFGSVLQEVFVLGEIITIIDTGNGNAFVGNYNDLPANGDLSAWRYIHWLIEIDGPEPSGSSYLTNRINRFGEMEEAAFEKGLLVSKSTIRAGKVKYNSYISVAGIAVPSEIVYETNAKEEFTIKLNEPEVNGELIATTFVPNLNKYNTYPLSVLK